ncbi:hypothetical protein CRG98_005511 [Punica granatum]|uniref:Uncharacterized protein n=1 Tax=Punica granatum TaxID=22663 RepID=A0A2I0L0B2_PUNGR|nr:hypothetical protein CRG98_005511 [Punica granatum]
MNLNFEGSEARVLWDMYCPKLGWIGLDLGTNAKNAFSPTELTTAVKWKATRRCVDLCGAPVKDYAGEQKKPTINYYALH